MSRTRNSARLANGLSVVYTLRTRCRQVLRYEEPPEKLGTPVAKFIAELLGKLRLRQHTSALETGVCSFSQLASLTAKDCCALGIPLSSSVRIVEAVRHELTEELPVNLSPIYTPAKGTQLFVTPPPELEQL